MDAQATSLFTSILVVSVIIGVIILFFIISIVRQQRRTRELYRRNLMAEINAMEQERARIAADLHDELSPLLAAIKLKINSFELPDEDDRIQVQKTNMHIDGLIQRMREISYDLLPNTLIRKGLVVAVKEFVEFVGRTSPVKISFIAPEQLKLPEQKSIHLYRIVQEVIHNTLKHSGASNLEILLEEKEQQLILTTKDDGVGFNHHAVSKSSKGIGLRSLLSRIEMVGGKMYVESAKGKGTRYTFETPLLHEQLLSSHKAAAG